MRNMWQIIVGTVLAAGVGLVLYNVVGGNDATNSVGSSPVQGQSTTQTKQPINIENPASTQSNLPTAEAEYGEMPVKVDEFVIGEATAPVTIIEYASLTCSHCAQFHNQVLPALKKGLIASGKVQLVFRDFPLDQLAMAGSVLARCGGHDRYFAFLDVLFRDQSSWTRSQDPFQALSQIARLGGIGKEKFQSCLSDKKLQEGIIKQRLDGNLKYQVNSTPTLFINGKKFSGGLTLGQIKAVVATMTPKS